MGLLIAQMRQAELIKHRSDLEYQLQLISTTKMDLSSKINEIVGLGADLDANSPEMKALEKKKERLYQAEKALDQKLKRYQNQLQMAESELQSVQQQVQQGIQRAYA